MKAYEAKQITEDNPTIPYWIEAINFAVNQRACLGQNEAAVVFPISMNRISVLKYLDDKGFTCSTESTTNYLIIAIKW